MCHNAEGGNLRDTVGPDRHTCQAGHGQGGDERAFVFVDGKDPGDQDEREEDADEKTDSNKAFQERTQDKHEHDGDKQEKEPADRDSGKRNVKFLGHVRIPPASFLRQADVSFAPALAPFPFPLSRSTPHLGLYTALHRH